MPRRPPPPWRLFGWIICSIVIGIAADARHAIAEDIIAVYSVYWAGLPAAKIRLRLRDSGPSYHNEIEIETQSLPHLLTRFRATALAEGSFGRDRPAEPSRYLAVYDLRKRTDRRISMQFVNGGGGTIAERAPDDTSRKPQLNESLRQNVVDPLSALARIRQMLRSRSREGSFTIPVYDGARRFDIVGHLLPKQDPADGALQAELILRPIAGFKGDTSEDGDPDDAPRKVELTISDDARMVPLSIKVPIFFMPLIVQLQRVCVAPDPCLG